jgi:hypothetical protein
MEQNMKERKITTFVIFAGLLFILFGCYKPKSNSLSNEKIKPLKGSTKNYEHMIGLSKKVKIQVLFPQKWRIKKQNFSNNKNSLVLDYKFNDYSYEIKANKGRKVFMLDKNKHGSLDHSLKSIFISSISGKQIKQGNSLEDYSILDPKCLEQYSTSKKIVIENLLNGWQTNDGTLTYLSQGKWRYCIYASKFESEKVIHEIIGLVKQNKLFNGAFYELFLIKNKKQTHLSIGWMTTNRDFSYEFQYDGDIRNAFEDFLSIKKIE